MTTSDTQAPSCHSSLSRVAKLALFILFAALVFLRLPNVLLEGRFFGEEGTYFFAYAWHMPWQDALWHPLGGYLNIVASGSTLLAKLLVTDGGLPLESAPYVTVLISLFFQLCPAMLILSCRDEWLNGCWIKPIALLLLVTVPFSEEVWLHSLHSQFHLTVCVALILASEVPKSGWARGARLALLLLAPLTGPAAIVLLPFLGLRALLDKDRARWTQVGALALGAAIQLLMFYAPVAVRAYSIGLDDLASVMLVRHLLFPFTGPGLAGVAIEAAQEAGKAGQIAWINAAASLVLFGGLIAIVLRNANKVAAWLIIPGLFLAGISYVGAIATGPALLSPVFGERYTYVPQIMINLGLLALFATAGPRVAKLSGVMLLLAMLFGLLLFRSHDDWFAGGPAWADEVALWRKDPQHRLVLWQPGWQVDLSPTTTRCKPFSGTLPEPAFCDSAWEARERDSLAEMPK